MSTRLKGFHSHGIREPLTNRIAGILDEYPDGTQIARELLQNSDDARSKVQWYLLDHHDRRSHTLAAGERLQLFHKDLDEYMGPALLAGSDSLFEEKDFKSMKNLAASEKKNDETKIGQMGIGFNSIYHMTDCPSFISGDQFMVVEPHERIFNGENSEYSEGAVRGNFVQEHLGLDMFPDQLKAFAVLEDIDFSKAHPGTIFRFPLRTKEQAKISKLSKNSYPAEQVLKMLLKLKDEALKGILFLKHIERIVIYERHQNEQLPKRLFEIEIVNGDEVSEQRQGLLAHLKNHVYPEPTASRDSILEYSVRPIFRLTETDGSFTEQTWHITTMVGNVLRAHQYMHEVTDGEGDLDNHKLIPWVGIAAPADLDVTIDSSRLFCFLPIGIQLPFPVHINGHFAVKQSRREIWTNQDNDFAKHASAYIKSVWNVHLFHSHIPVVYAKFLQTLGLARGPNYDLWPVSCGEGLGLDAIWKDLLVQLVTVACRDSLSIFFCGTKERQDLRMVDYKSSWVVGRDLDEYPLLIEALRDSVNVITDLPDAALDAIRVVSESRVVENRILNPALVRRLLRENKNSWSSTATDDTRVEMLKYCTDDRKVLDLEGLPLLPLAGGLWVDFSRKHACERFLVSKVTFKVLRYSNEGLVDIGINQDLVSRFRDSKTDDNNRYGSDGMGPELFEDVFWTSITIPVLGSRIRGIYQKSYYENKPIPTHAMPQPQDGTFPTDDWITSFWLMAQAEKEEQQVELMKDMFGLHLLPITRHRLAPLDTEMQVVYMDRTDNEREPNLASFFSVLDEQFECRVLRKGFKITSRNAFSYMLEISDAVGILKVTATVPMERRQGLDQEHCQVVCDYMARWLSLDSELDQLQLSALRSLPIYRMYSDSTFAPLLHQNGEKVSWGVASRFSRAENPWLPVTIKLLEDDQPMLEHLTEVLGVPTVNESKYWFKILSNLNSYTTDMWDLMLEQFCQKYHAHVASNEHSFNFMSDLEFVLTAGPDSSKTGPRRSPRSIVNPSLSPFYLDHECVFPAGVYTNSAIFSVLSEMGMQATFDASFITDRARVLSADTKQGGTGKRDTALMALYSRLNDSFKRSLQSPQMQRILGGLPWILAKSLNADDYQLCYPSECRPQGDVVLVGSQIPLAKFNFSNELILDCLGWNTPPPLEKVLAHFHTVIDCTSTTTPSEAEFNAIYRHLMGLISDSKSLMIIRESLSGKAWILINGTLHTTDRVALKMSWDLSPYFVQIASPGLDHLFSAMGVRQNVQQQDLEEIIEQIGRQYGPTRKLSDEDAQLVLQLLSGVARISYTWSPRTLILTTDNQLRKIGEVVYDDRRSHTSIKDARSGGNEASEYTFAHSGITAIVADALKIPVYSTRFWHDKRDSTFVAWEQQEDIVDRIKGILNDYDPSNIFTEFLQNAADAGATKCTFMLDTRSFGRDNLFSKEMAAWQGPALVIYNDAEMTENDFVALSKLGVGSKRDDASKIGRHGLGFNSVYHFTDVPSVVSGSYIGFFDPRLEFLPPIQSERGLIYQGGQRCEFLNIKGDAALADQLAPYKGIFGCDMESHFSGTIFRLPLRTLDSTSRLHDTSSSRLGDTWQLSHIQDMMRKWVGESEVAMLFLDNLRVIDLRDNDKLDMRTTMTPVSTPFEQKLHSSEGSDALSQILQVRLEGTGSRTGFQRKWLVRSERNFPLGTPQNIKELADKNHWNPHRGIALPLALTQKELDEFKGRIFTHLPTMIATEVPFHIHGLFALTSNRKSLAGGSDEQDYKFIWNRFLLGECLPMTAIRAFETLLRWQFRDPVHGGPNSRDIGRATYTYFHYWPVKGRSDIGHLSHFIKVFMRVAHTTPVFPCRFSSKKPEVEGMKGREIVFTGNIAPPEDLLTVIRSSLQSAGFNLCDCPVAVQRRVEDEWKQVPNIIFQQINDDHVRRLIRDDPTFIPNKVKTPDGKRWILEYTLKALLDPKSKPTVPIAGLALLPLMNGEWKPLQSSPMYFTAREDIRGLIRGENVLVDESFFRNTRPEAKAGEQKVIHILEQILQRLIRDPSFGVAELPPEVLSSTACVEYPNGISEEYRGRFWRLLEKYKILDDFGELQLLKDLNGAMHPLKSCRLGFEISHMEVTLRGQVEKLSGVLSDMKFVLYNATDNYKHPYLIEKALKCTASSIAIDIARRCNFISETRVFTQEEASALRNVIDMAGVDLKSEAAPLGRLKIWRSWGSVTNKGHSLIAANGSYYMEGQYDLTSLGTFPDIILQSPYCEHFLAMGASPMNLVKAAETRVMPTFWNKTLSCTGATKAAYLGMLRHLMRNAAVTGRKVDHRAKQLLQSGRIILARDNTFKTSRELFDPLDTLLAVVFADEPERFPDQIVWDTVMQKKHLFAFRSQNDSTVISECANHILHLTKGLTSLGPQDVRSRASYFVQHVYLTVANSGINWMDPKWAIVPSQVAETSPHNELVPDVGEYMPFAELIDPQYRDIVWTKRAFFPEQLKPSPLFKANFPEVGVPPIESIVCHLSALVKDLAPLWTSEEQQLHLRMSLLKVYKELDDFATQSETNKDHLNELLNSHLQVPYIMNGQVEDPSKRESWLWPSQLMLDIDNDMPRHKVVHKSLDGVRNFLVAAGVPQMQKVEGSVTVPEGRRKGDIEDRLANCFESQDRHNGFMDVRFKFSNGQQIMAHKFMLAHANQYFARRFTGAWAEYIVREPSEPGIEVIDLSNFQDVTYEAFWGLIYFVYTDQLIHSNGPALPNDARVQDVGVHGNTGADDLRDRVQYLMELQHLSDQYDETTRLKSLIASEIVLGQKVLHGNVFNVLAHATQNQCKDIQGYCEKYIRKNRSTVRNYVDGELQYYKRLLEELADDEDKGAQRAELKREIEELEGHLQAFMTLLM